MSRLQLALNVSNLATAIDFYTRLFGSPPAKVRPGYANFSIVEPPLKLVLIENSAEAGTMNHLGIEVESAEEVQAAISRLQSQGLATDVEEQTTCCFALQDKVWVHGPDAEPWEVYTVLADAPVMKSTESECCDTTSAIALSARPTTDGTPIRS